MESQPPKSYLGAVAQRHDQAVKTLTRIQQVIHSRQGHEATVWFLSEISCLLVEASALLTRHAQKPQAFKTLRALAARLPSRLSPSPERMVSLGAGAASASERMQILTVILSDWQVLNRLWGLMDTWLILHGMLAETLRRVREKQPVDAGETAMRVLEQICLAGYYFGEGSAWLARRKLISLSAKTQEWMDALSLKSFGAACFIQTARLAYQLRQRRKASREGGTEEDEKAWMEAWRAEVGEASAWLPLAVHWAVPGGIFPNIVVNLMAVYASMIPVSAMWRKTAQ